MYSGTEKSFKDKDNGISYADFPRGNAVFVSHLVTDLSDGPHFDFVHDGNVRLEVRFAQNLQAAVTCLVHAEYDSLTEVHKDRNISPEYVV